MEVVVKSQIPGRAPGKSMTTQVVPTIALPHDQAVPSGPSRYDVHTTGPTGSVKNHKIRTSKLVHGQEGGET